MKDAFPKHATAVLLLWLVVLLVVAGGWIANIVKLVGSDFGHITGLLILRVIGIFIAPLGGAIGYL